MPKFYCFADILDTGRILSFYSTNPHIIMYLETTIIYNLVKN